VEIRSKTVALHKTTWKAPFMSDLKLCIATYASFPTPGGVEMRINRYLPGFRERGIEVEVIAGTPSVNKMTEQHQASDWFDKPMGYKFQPVVLDRTPVHRVRLPDEHGWRRIRVLNRKLVEVFKSGEYDPDIVHLLSSKPQLSFPLLGKLRRLGKGIVYSYAIAHKLPPLKLARDAKEFFLKQTYNRFDRMIVASDELKSFILDLGVTCQIEVIPNGVDTELYSPPADEAEKREIRKALGLPAEAFIILGVGSVYPRKGVDLLLEAWHRLVKRHPEVQIVWVGRRRDVFDPFLAPYNEVLEKLLRAGDAPGKVHMVGQSDEVDRYLKAADLFAFPTEREGMPNAVLEAAASQLPIVLTKYRGFSELIGKPGRDYVLIDRTVEDIEAAIEDLIENPQKRRELGANARRFIEENMPLSRSVDMHVDVYRDVLGRLKA
jgi:glycosyltransferase involved in cell wall biosynthesis